MNRRARACLAVALLPLAACVYYNAMWSAERFARQARRAETQGQGNEARVLWLRAAIKAESVATRHPESRWADDAMVLRAEALVRAGSCSQADAALARVRDLSDPLELSERARLAAAECDVANGLFGTALAMLEPLIESRDAGRRARATYFAGRAAWGQGDGPRAVALLARSGHPAAPATRARVLLASGQAAAGLALLDSLVTRRFVEAEWTELLDAAARDASTADASALLDALLGRGRVPLDAAARLLTADGDRRAAAHEWSAAAASYAAAAAAAPDVATGDAARARRLRVLATDVENLAELEDLANELGRLRGAGDQRDFNSLLAQILRPESDAAAFRAAELARDSLHAPKLAVQLFRDFPARWPQSVFAPKAIVASIALQPEHADALAAELDRRYPTSPYTLAWRGESAPALAAAEDSLARALGFATDDGPDALTQGPRPPETGPRSVWLDPPSVSGGGRAQAARTPPPVKPATATPAKRPAARPGDRPVDPDA